MWPRSTADPDGPATIANLGALEQLVTWPKLFRRIVPYLASGFTDFDGFDTWLRADPINRDDELFLIEKLERGHARCRPRRWPADPAHGLARGLHHQPGPAARRWYYRPTTGHHRRCADPGCTPGSRGDRPRQRIGHLLNTTATSIDLTGWGPVDAAGGRKPDGTIVAGGVVQVTAEGALQLGSQGDTIVLVDGGGSIDQVTYKADRVRPGRTICFGR